MFCHAGLSPPGCAAGASAAGAGLAAGFAARPGRGSVAVMRASFGAKGGTGVPVLRAFRVRARAGVGAGAVRAPDCARETQDAPRPSVPAGVFFAAPSRLLSAETPKGGPGSRLSLLSSYTIPPNVKPVRKQKVKLPAILSVTRCAGGRQSCHGFRSTTVGIRREPGSDRHPSGREPPWSAKGCKSEPCRRRRRRTDARPGR